jgi:hypothetical protein
MGRSLEICLALNFLVSAGLTVQAESTSNDRVDSRLKITIRVYNKAQVPAQALSRSLQEATRIFSETGIDTVWLGCPASYKPAPALPVCQEALSPMVLGLTILPQNETTGAGLPDGLFGFALPYADGGVRASIFYQHAREFARGGPASLVQVLGHVMAHEIGHLLLWSNSHSRAGLMRGGWSRDDLIRIASGHLGFASEEVQTMIDNVLRRAKQQEALQACRLASQKEATPNLYPNTNVLKGVFFLPIFCLG